MVTGKKIALIGANGMLANMLIKSAPTAVELTNYDLPDFDITSREQVLCQLSALHPDVIINCAAFTNVDGCESQVELAAKVNGVGPGILADVADRFGATLVHISTDFVFSGTQTTPYSEDDSTGPLSVYGQSKLAGEQAIISSGLNNYYIVRTSWLYGPGGANFVETIARLAAEREQLGIVNDQVGTPTYTADLAQAIWTLISPITSNLSPVTAPYGIYHYSNSGACTWYDFAGEIVSHLRQSALALKIKDLRPIATADYPLPAQRPAYSVLSKEKIVAATGVNIPSWQESLKKYLNDRVKN